MLHIPAGDEMHDVTGNEALATDWEIIHES